MKRRIRRITNFFAFNLLFFALYLNFIHKDNANPAATSASVDEANSTALIQKQAEKKPILSVSATQVK